MLGIRTASHRPSVSKATGHSHLFVGSLPAANLTDTVSMLVTICKVKANDIYVALLHQILALGPVLVGQVSGMYNRLNARATD